MKMIMQKNIEMFTRPIRTATKTHGIRNILIFLVSCVILLSGFLLIWVSTFQIPSLDTLEERKISQSTKIYDSTGKILLYDIFQTKRRTIIPFNQISQNIKDATLSIEDKEFYTHHGFKPTAIIRAFFQNILSLSLSQGGSTITQQVVKNTILTLDKTPTRKLKELVLSLKLDRMLPKDEIFNMYLNEIPYGGSIYGVEEASETYFGKPASDVTLAEAAYLASIPQRPTYYSPYGKNKDKLEERKNLVLKEMLRDGKIDETKYNEAVNEKVTFLPKEDRGIKAPHFVMFVKEYLEEKYGQDVLEQGGLKVTTTLNYELQKKAEDVAKRYAFENKKNFNGENAAFVAIDPKTGGILSMVGSRDYFDKEIDGNFNVTTAHRQPGSTFKPFVYAESFLKGYTPDTVLFDLKTQFSVKCAPENMTSTNGCYSPENYDGKFRGPMTLRDALAQSINVPSVKLLYLAGIADSINLARSMGIQSLGDANQYGLTLVLGGGEVSLLDMTSAYGVFANDGVRNPYVSILKVEDKNGKVLEELNPKPIQVLDPEAARKISDILSDNVARSPGYGTNSPLYFAGRDVAVKTGTTNDYKDTWIIGYTPSVVVGAWAGNNNNTPMEKKVAGLIVAPMWRAFMDEVVKTLPINDQFTKPQQENSLEIKPVLRGKWQGGISTITPSPTGGETESLSGGVHSILYWLDKDNPRGEQPTNPSDDPQFVRWEYPVRIWAQQQGLQ
jgi:1A family penicillin-binding protein